MADLIALVERVESGVGRDADLDFDLVFAFIPAPEDVEGRRAAWALVGSERGITGSLDAAVSLVERVLPGWCWALERTAADKFEASVFSAIATWGDLRSAVAASPARALLAACLRALQSKDTSNV